MAFFEIDKKQVDPGTYPWGVPDIGFQTFPDIMDPAIAHLWSEGDVVRLGVDQEYTDIDACVNAVNPGTLILVYPGTWQPAFSGRWSKGVMFRGMGEPGEVKMYRPNNLLLFEGGQWFFENITFPNSQDYKGSIALHTSADPLLSLFFSKCYFASTGNAYGVQGNTGVAAELIFSQCRMDKGRAQLANANRTNVRFRKTYAPSFECRSVCSGDYAEFDLVTSATEGYGHLPGNFLINGLEALP